MVVYGAKQITCAGVDFFRANKAYIKANASQVLNDGKAFIRALEKTSNKGVTLSSNGAGQFNNIKNTVKEYKALKNIDSASKKMTSEIKANNVGKADDIVKSSVVKETSIEGINKINFDNEIPRSGEEWNEHLINKYGKEKVEFVFKGVSKAEVKLGRTDLDNLRKKWNVPETNTVAVGKTDIPGLENFTFEGCSPEVRKEAGLPTLDEIFPNREFKAPYNYKANPRLAQFTKHAEEGVLNEFDEAIKREDIKPKDVSGTLYVNQSNPRGVCNKCKGINKEFSRR